MRVGVRECHLNERVEMAMRKSGGTHLVVHVLVRGQFVDCLLPAVGGLFQPLRLAPIVKGASDENFVGVRVRPARLWLVVPVWSGLQLDYARTI